MVEALDDRERALLDALASDPDDRSARAALAARWATRDPGWAALVADGGASLAPAEVAAIEARLCAPLLRAGFAASSLALDRGLLRRPLALPVDGSLDRDLDVARLAPRRLRLMSTLANGASQTFHAVEVLTARTVASAALAVVHPDPAARARFAHAQRLLRAIEHPALPGRSTPVIHAGGEAALVRLAGRDLGRRPAGAPPDPEAAVAVAVALADVAATLHAGGAVHGAIRPEHVVVTDDGALTLVGLGGARLGGAGADDDDRPEPDADGDGWRTWLRYLSPEQVGGTTPGPAADVWAIATLACELAAGAHPLAAADDPLAIAAAIAAGWAPPATLPPLVVAALTGALARAPERRPSAAALRDALVDGATGLDLGDRARARLALTATAPATRDAPAATEVAAGPTEAAGAPARCPCPWLAAGLPAPHDGDALVAFSRGLTRERWLFQTQPHLGDAELRRCPRCGAAAIELLVEHEGFTGSIHRYLTVLSGREEEALAAGELDGDGYEAWAGARAGIHLAGGRAVQYAQARVGWLGLDHGLLA